MRFLCWQPVLTDHQAYTFAALSSAAAAPLASVALTRHLAVRADQGWNSLGLEAFSPQILPKHRWLTSVIRLLREDKSRVHIFCSPFGHFKITTALLIALYMGRRVYLVSEPYSPNRASYFETRPGPANAVKASLRPVIYRIYGWLIRRRVAGVFAISPLAVTQYKSIGIAREKIWPFGYFVPRSYSLSKKIAGLVEGGSSQSGIRLCFVGALIHRKGVHQLIEAAHQVTAKGLRVSVDFFGSGDPDLFAFDPQIARYCGTISFGMAGQVMAQYDGLVVPSIHDGWGVVVNEALMEGVPVIASKTTGAAAMLVKHQCGLTFDPADADSLPATLLRFGSDSELRQKMTVAAQKLDHLLSPETAGRYMNCIINGSGAITAPWYDT